MLSSLKSRITVGASVFALLALGLSMSMSSTHGQDDTVSAAAAGKVKVGTYEVNQALHSYHKTQAFIAYAQGLEEDFVAAQQAGDHARVMQMQMEVQQREQDVLTSFHSAIDLAMPKIAREHNLQVIALELIYHDPAIDPQDITDDVVREINVDAAAAPAAEDNDDE